MRRHEAYPSKYTKAADLDGETVVATIVRVTHEPMQDGGLKPIAHFDKLEKGAVVNATNADFLYGIGGSDDDKDWPGATVELYATIVRKPGGGTVESIAFRHPPKAKKANKNPSEIDPPPHDGDIGAAVEDEIPY